jgi:hypothetical protein
MQKEQQTEDQTCTKLGSGRVGTRMETQQLIAPLVSLLYTVAKRGGAAVLLGTRETCDHFSLNVNTLEKNDIFISLLHGQYLLC